MTDGGIRRLLETEHAVSQLLATSRSFAEVAPQLLRSIAEPAGWRVALLWMVDEPARVIRAVDCWRAANCAVDAFLDDSRRRAFRKGTGLPGRVWESGRTTWVDDVVSNGNFPRAGIAERLGLHGAIAFPLRVREAVAGVVELFREEMNAPDSEMLQLFERLSQAKDDVTLSRVKGSWARC